MQCHFQKHSHTLLSLFPISDAINKTNPTHLAALLTRNLYPRHFPHTITPNPPHTFCLSSLSPSLSLLLPSLPLLFPYIYLVSLLTIKIFHSPIITLLPLLPMTLSFFPYHCSSPIKFHGSSSLAFLSPVPASSRRPRWPRMDAASAYHRHRRKDKVVVVMGATGTGKSRLSIDLATRCACSEIINSDKMQVYRGLDITTNKIPLGERKGVPHHLLGDVDPAYGEFTPSDFRSTAGLIISDISSRRKLPIVVGGSNSFVHALLAERFDSDINMFDDESPSLISSELRYKCCLLWVDVSFPVLSDYLLKRVDDMLDSGMVDELARFFDPGASDIEDESEHRVGLMKAIGVPEFDRYFKRYPPQSGGFEIGRDRVQKAAYEEAVRAIKENTCQLVKRQIGKILRLKGAGWDLRRLDATEAFRAAMMPSGCSGGGERWSDIWERQVAEQSVKIVKRFLKE